MLKNIFQSLGAALLGLFIGVVLSVGTDFILQTLRVIPKDSLYVSWITIVFVLLYRSAFNTVACYVTARLAPNRPMGHALALGVLGTIVSVMGAIVTADKHLGPAWYAWTLAALSLPSAWLGGKLAVKRIADMKKTP